MIKKPEVRMNIKISLIEHVIEFFLTVWLYIYIYEMNVANKWCGIH
jgi:hypothetical protein